MQSVLFLDQMKNRAILFCQGKSFNGSMLVGYLVRLQKRRNFAHFDAKIRHLIIDFLFSSQSHSTRLLAATTLRNVLGTKNLAEILSERETISHVMQSSLDDATDPW